MGIRRGRMDSRGYKRISVLKEKNFLAVLFM